MGGKKATPAPKAKPQQPMSAERPVTNTHRRGGQSARKK